MILNWVDCLLFKITLHISAYIGNGYWWGLIKIYYSFSSWRLQHHTALILLLQNEQL